MLKIIPWGDLYNNRKLLVCVHQSSLFFGKNISGKSHSHTTMALCVLPYLQNVRGSFTMHRFEIAP